MVEIEAPGPSYRLVMLETDEPHPVEEWPFDINLNEPFIDWCQEHGIDLPSVRYELAEGHLDIWLCFPTEADAVHFTLLWKGCGTT